MAILIRNSAVLLILTMLFSACVGNLDFTGFVTTAESVDQRFDQSMEWNAQHPEDTLWVSESNYSLYVAGDIHVGPTENLELFTSEALVNSIPACIAVGDICTGKKEDYQTFKNHYDAIAPQKMFVMAGNHDLYFEGWTEFYKHFGSSTYTFVVNTPEGNDLFICLESGSAMHGTKQLLWLEEVLSTRRNHFRYCTVFTHTNFFREHRTSSTNPLMEELYVLLDLFSDHNVNLMVMGHDHQRTVETLGPTTYITMDALKDANTNASWLELSYEPNKTSYTFRDIP